MYVIVIFKPRNAHFVYIFLSNRVNPGGGSNTRLERLNVRGKVQDAFYRAMGAEE